MSSKGLPSVLASELVGVTIDGDFTIAILSR